MVWQVIDKYSRDYFFQIKSSVEVINEWCTSCCYRSWAGYYLLTIITFISFNIFMYTWWACVKRKSEKKDIKRKEREKSKRWFCSKSLICKSWEWWFYSLPVILFCEPVVAGNDVGSKVGNKAVTCFFVQLSRTGLTHQVINWYIRMNYSFRKC